MSSGSDLVDVYEEYAADPKFDGLRATGSKLVWGRGNKKTPLAMVIGEAPGANEDRLGKPFVGASGTLLTGLLRLAEIDPEECWITNAVKYRPTLYGNNRTPFYDEIMDGAKYLRKEWKAVGKPPLMITCGAVPLKAILRGKAQSVGKMVGEPIRLRDDLVLVPMFHPAYPLRQRSLIPIVEQQWTDLTPIVQLARTLAGGKQWPEEVSAPTE